MTKNKKAVTEVKTMPKPFSEQQKKIIKDNLIATATKLMSQSPIRKISVDTLVREVGISKGAFYLFYENKEQLFFDCIMEIHQEIEMKTFNQIQSITKNSKQSFKELILTMIFEVEKAPWLLNLNSEFLSDLMKNIPKEKIELHIQKDNLINKQVLEYFGLVNKDIELISGALRAIFLLLLHKQEIGDIFPAVLNFNLDAIINHIFKE